MVRARRLLLLGAALAGVAAMTAALYGTVSAGMRDSRQSGYRALLDAQVARLQQWIDERRADVEQLAADPQVRQIAGRVSGGGVDHCASQAADLATIQSVLAFRFGRQAPAHVHLLAEDGRVILSSSPGRCGTRLPDEVLARLVLARQRGSAFIRPLDGTHGAGLPLVWYEAPVRDAVGNVAAFIGYGVAATDAFGFLADKGRFGDTGEVYVVDPQGRAISPRRWPVSGDGAAQPSVLLGQLVAGRERAAAEGDPMGAVLEPYVAYGGRDVVGVWRWLPRRGIGLVLEQDAAEAFGPVRYLRWMAWQLGIMAVLVLGGGLALQRLEGRAGRRIGPYRVLSLLGEGAVSNVYLAEHLLMRRQVALKVLKPRAASDEWLARFRREARLAGQLHHPNFVRLFDYDRMDGGGFYYAMEYLKGCNLAELVEREGPQPAARVVKLLRQVCTALEEAHGLGILHRDIKPQNIMLCEVAGQPDVVKVLDFGLVKQVRGEASRDLTAGLRILGTPAYLAPERITDPASTNPRSDLYAVGAVGYFLLTGRKPFESESDLQLTHRILHEEVPRASTFSPAAVPPALDDLLARCLAKNPDERPASARALGRELAALG